MFNIFDISLLLVFTKTFESIHVFSLQLRSFEIFSTALQGVVLAEGVLVMVGEGGGDGDDGGDDDGSVVNLYLACLSISSSKPRMNKYLQQLLGYFSRLGLRPLP
jgi:hypothetical protein